MDTRNTIDWNMQGKFSHNNVIPMSHYKEEHYYYYLKEGEKSKKLYKKFLIFNCFPPIFFFKKIKNIILPWKQRIGKKNP